MKIFILPLIVISQLDLSNDKWQFGPELIYNVSYLAKADSQSPINVSQRLSTHHMQTKLRCRPRTPTILNCHLDKQTVDLSFVNTSNPNHPLNVSEVNEHGLENFNFELNFNRFGIKELTVPASIVPMNLDTIRAIVNQFHTGMDLTDRSEGTHRAWENFTTGHCFTSYTIKLSTTNLDSKSGGKKLKWHPDSPIFINKTRNLGKCRLLAPYFFGSRENWQNHPELQVTIKSSKSIIEANTTAFSSRTEASEILSDLKSPKVTFMDEVMTVTFDSVVPAQKEISKVEDPAFASLVTGQWLHDSSSEEKDSDERN